MMYPAVRSLIVRSLPQITGSRGLQAIKLRAMLWLAAFRNRDRLSALMASSSPALQRILAEYPELVTGSLIGPYLCAAWNLEERLKHIEGHYRTLDGFGAPFRFSVSEQLVLAELDDIHPGLRIVLDQPRWFMREGGLTINLFVDDFRAYSLAFSFADYTPDEGIDCLIGALQGRNVDMATDLYRDLTKAAHGLRPRDLLIEICRMLCRHWQVGNILAIRDEHRHHRHPFFSGKKIAPQDYDQIWQDRGGEPADAFFYRLPIASERRADDEIKPNKRSLYRRRYRFLDQLEAEISGALPGLVPTPSEGR